MSLPARIRPAIAPVPPHAERGVRGAWSGSARRLMWSGVLARRRDFVAASALYSTHQLGESMVPVIIGATIGDAIAHGGWERIGLWLAVLAMDFAFLSLSYRFGARASMRAVQHGSHRMRMLLTERAVQPGGGIALAPGELLARASSDAARVGSFAGAVAFTAASAVALLVAVALLLHYSPLLGAVILAGTVLLLFVQRQTARALERRSGAEQGAQARATSLAEDIVRGLRVLRGIGAQPEAVRGYERVNREAVRAARRTVSSEALLDSSALLLTGLYLAIIAITGGVLALHGQLGLGSLVSALGLAQFIVGPMQSLSTAYAAHARALASAQRIREVLVAEPAVHDRTATPRATEAGSPSIELRDIRLGAVPLSARIEGGRMTGIVCPDAQAAAELARLLARESDPAGGAILLDDVDTARMPLEELRSRVLVALHDADLLPGSIADNLGLVAASRDAARDAAFAAFADQVVDVVPGGADAFVGDRGELLSGGQQQRVLLGRALAAEPSALVLHEPTTAVDAVTEDLVAQRVAALRAGRTTVVITSSPAWLSRCRRVLFVTSSGARTAAHAELLAASPAYRAAVAR